MYSIYMIVNKINNKVYIGKTSMSIEKRWKLHLSDAKKRRNLYFRNAIMKYGVESFSVYKLCEAPDNDRANDIERFYIQLFETHIRTKGYNSTLGGAGVVPNEETRLKIKLTKLSPDNPMRGRPLSKEHRDKVVAALYGHTVSQETRIKIGNANRDRIFTDKQKAGMGRGNLGKKMSEETRANMSKARKGEGSPWFGKRLSDEHRKKLSVSHLGLKYPGRVRRKKTVESPIKNDTGNKIS